MAERPDPRRRGSGAPFDREINYKAVFGFLVGTVLITVVAFTLMWYLGVGLRSFLETRDPEPPPIAEARQPAPPPQPRLQTHPTQDLLELRAYEDSVLHTYELLDRERGIVRIPVDEAKRLVTEQGLPEWSALAPSPDSGR